MGPWTRELEGADAVIQLAGCPVNCRYNPRDRADILAARVDATRVVGQALHPCRHPPRAWLQASTATLYAHRLDAPNDEATGILGGDEPGAPDTWNFSIDVARAWEAAAVESAPAHVRLVLLRSAMTMSPDPGGVFDVLLGLARRGLGGTQGDGRQYVSRIHQADLCRATDLLLANDWSGPVNLSEPNPLPNAAFMRALRGAASAIRVRSVTLTFCWNHPFCRSGRRPRCGCFEVGLGGPIALRRESTWLHRHPSGEDTEAGTLMSVPA